MLKRWDPNEAHAVEGIGPVFGVSSWEARFSGPQLDDDYFGPEFDVSTGMTVLDVGANVGLFTLQLLQRVRGDARVLAFEPAPVNFDYLQRNIETLWPDADVSLFRSAVAAEPGESTFYYRPRVPAMSSLAPEPPEHDRDKVIEAALREPPAKLRSGPLHRMPRPVRRAVMHGLARWTSAPEAVAMDCPVTTVSAVLEEHGIEQVDYLKVDVEGAELDVLRGIDEPDWAKIRQVAVETHDVDGRLTELRTLLEGAGLSVTSAQHWPFEGTNVHMVHGVR